MIPMNIKSKAGFTLVELIVVIAILGILAGIAVPAYSGYIKKANTAGDTQVLSAVYTAAASAYAAKGDVTGITVTCGSTTTDGKTTYDSNVTTITVTGTGEGDNATLAAYKYDAGATPKETGDPDFLLFIGKALSNSPDFKSETYQKGASWNATNGWQPVA